MIHSCFVCFVIVEFVFAIGLIDLELIDLELIDLGITSWDRRRLICWLLLATGFFLLNKGFFFFNVFLIKIEFFLRWGTNNFLFKKKDFPRLLHILLLISLILLNFLLITLICKEIPKVNLALASVNSFFSALKNFFLASKYYKSLASLKEISSFSNFAK